MSLKYRNVAETKLKQKIMAILLALIVTLFNLNIFSPFLHKKLKI